MRALAWLLITILALSGSMPACARPAMAAPCVGTTDHAAGHAAPGHHDCAAAPCIGCIPAVPRGEELMVPRASAGVPLVALVTTPLGGAAPAFPTPPPRA